MKKLDHTASGVYAIAVTPFTPDGAVDTASVDRMTDFYLSCGVSCLTVLGMMGEAPKLDAAEALAISNQVARRANVPVVVGVPALKRHSQFGPASRNRLRACFQGEWNL